MHNSHYIQLTIRCSFNMHACGLPEMYVHTGFGLAAPGLWIASCNYIKYHICMARYNYCTYVHACMHTHTHAYTHTQMHTHTHTRTHARAHTHACVHTHTHTYIHTHTLVEGTTQLCRTSRLSINSRNVDNYCMNKPKEIRRVWGLILGHSQSA